MSNGEISIDNRLKAIFFGRLRTTRNSFGSLAKREFDRFVDQVFSRTKVTIESAVS